MGDCDTHPSIFLEVNIIISEKKYKGFEQGVYIVDNKLITKFILKIASCNLFEVSLSFLHSTTGSVTKDGKRRLLYKVLRYTPSG